MAQTGCEVKGALRRLEGVQARGTQAGALSPGACPGPGEGLHPVSQGTGSGQRGSFLGSRRAPHLHQKKPQDRPLQDAKQLNTRRLSVQGCITGRTPEMAEIQQYTFHKQQS